MLCALLVALALSMQLWLTSLFPFRIALLRSAIDILPWLIVLPGIAWLAKRFPLHGAQRIRHACIHLVACLACSWVLPASALLLIRASGLDLRPSPPVRMLFLNTPAIGAPPPRPPDELALGRGFGPQLVRRGPPTMLRLSLIRAPFHWAIYGLVVALIHGWNFARRANERERRAAELERSLTEARLTSLTRQLQPHFLFNTLNTIAALVRHDANRAEALLLDLSELLRLTLRASDRHTVPLHEELSLLDRYIDIQRARFGSRLDVLKKIEPETLTAQVPVLLLQPLVENAICHGLDTSFDQVNVTIESSQDAGRLRIAISDNGCGDSGHSTPGEGIGLSNTRARLETLFGAEASFHPRPLPGRGFIAECLLPIRPAPIPT